MLNKVNAIPEVDSFNVAMDIEDIDYLQLYTGNAKQSVYYLCKLFGFRLKAYSGLETGNRETCSYVLEQGDIRLLISSAYSGNHPISECIKNCGEGVRDIAFRVGDVEKVFHEAVLKGATVIQEPSVETDEFGIYKKAVIGTFGSTVHTLVESKNYEGCFAPGFKELHDNYEPAFTGLTRIDHLGICVENMRKWTSFYEEVLGFSFVNEFKKGEVSSNNSSLMTKVVQNGTERVKFPIIEPAEGSRKSQIQEFLDYNGGAGVQHIALLTDNIIETVDTLQTNGIDFLYTPDAYYKMLEERIGNIDETIEELNKYNILADRDEEGYLLQIFGYPVSDRPTLFFEIIQRKGSKGFGNGNIRALFESVERVQEQRGNL
ncbi:4-hydroxyphenylpyruvate dioxygenase [Paenibacillus plantiphilus]|uniref:4-hydroxyphenylpyruvate dioxygenase n=1 Tax=Paenibacillus plantiphilus TaxID=2905650 RepID=A0ABN8GDW1_9BACL|nr:4-hydroxyphenylpyruvate dioxygenase [Paenibacillus plantiphilus]CAH1206486.1 4-hydroxyphenylpyruvate dioxygenase [Paenibacillus plantiphilus]